MGQVRQRLGHGVPEYASGQGRVNRNVDSGRFQRIRMQRAQCAACIHVDHERHAHAIPCQANLGEDIGVGLDFKEYRIGARLGEGARATDRRGS